TDWLQRVQALPRFVPMPSAASVTA
ncbi:glutathione S-transferase family protein, partial [Xanthomonas oryzae pv. oryzae]